MRKLFVAMMILAGVGLALFGDSPRPGVAAPAQGVFWVNDSNAISGGQGIFQLTMEGAVKLLIPNQRLGAKQGGGPTWLWMPKARSSFWITMVSESSRQLQPETYL